MVSLDKSLSIPDIVCQYVRDAQCTPDMPISRHADQNRRYKMKKDHPNQKRAATIDELER